MKISKTLFLLGMLCTALTACKKSDVPATGAEVPSPVATLPTGTSGPSPGTFSSDKTYNLNVIYFIPADVAPVANYQKRISELLLWGQNWYKEQMALNGYPNKTFGLYTDAQKKNVRLIIIQGTKSKSEYKYEGGSGNIVTEVNAFFSANPTLKTGEHNLIIVPAYFMKTDGTPGGGAFGPPFYGIGKTCFALDYEEMDVKHVGASGILGDAFSVWFGGLMHELGHGLNLPHNCQKVSENNDPLKGMALMWGGNGTLGKSPTFLTAADAAVLNVNQVFNTGPKIYYSAVNSSITRIHADYVSAKGAIVVSGRFNTNGHVNSVLYYNDPNVNNEGTGTNKDYNATTWESKSIGTDSFYVEMPISELKYKTDGMVYELKVKLVNDNGNVTETIYPYVFNAGIPVIDFGQKASQYNSSNWSILSFSSNQTSGDDGKASNIIDGNFSSSWISRWSSPVALHPHYVAVDMKIPLQITGFTIAMESRYETKSKNIELLTSNDGTNWSTAGNYVLKQIFGPQHIYLPAARTARYVKLVVNSAWNGTSAANIAEIAAFNE
ncbi:F5/8 type C domain-containing protein [Pedobacter steynii]|uniref:F5/8 type C domain-containing protein n=1 Tax=Pedobacter steynii TaxID=430522 RepID=A0A1G9N502_9SPHI|nr:discoidin domain-containing protein [Pedobacter steynii]NQX39408.1 discoidin domain-containing protein [Pedobacter steynii]SDL81558.1 F5/8 type C domain-containing protein [Pedobacter steynii]